MWYNNIRQKKTESGTRINASVKLPLNIIAQDVNDLYINSREGDRFDLLAFKYYGDVRYWRVIALANNLVNGSMVIPSGLKIRIPNNPQEFKRRYDLDNS